MLSLPRPPAKALSFASPVSVSLWTEPPTPSMPLSESLPAPPDEVPLARFTFTAEPALA